MVLDKGKVSHGGTPLSEENRTLLVEGALRLGVSLDSGMVGACERFLDELMKWNERMNLTAIRQGRLIIVRHFLDSLLLVKHIPQAALLLDIGSGAGFPGVPLKIARPDLEVVLLEATRKKTYFHKRVIRSLDLSGIRSVWGRSDTEDMRRVLGGGFDVVVSRAVSSLEVFVRDAIHFARAGGMIIAMRGRDMDVRISPESFGLYLDRTVAVDLPFERARRYLLFFKRKGWSIG